MSSDLSRHLRNVEAPDDKIAALIFQKVFSICEDIALMRDIFQAADENDDNILIANTGSLCRMAEKIVDELFSAAILLCPSIDRYGYKQQLVENFIEKNRRTEKREHSCF